MIFFSIKNISRLLPCKMAILSLGMVCFCLSSCFTGIESTKKINLTREDKKNLVPTREESFMTQVQSSPLKYWEQGKNFFVSDNKALLVIVPQSGLLPFAPDSVKGKIFDFTGVESKINAAGKITVSLLFTDGIYNYAYDSGKEFDNAMENLMSDQIPMLIDEDMVIQAKQLLVGQNFWSRSNLWYDEKGNRIDGKKYVEVKVVDVQPGDMVFPLRLKLKTLDDETAYVLMNFGNSDTESRSFHNLFSLTDIKKHYPNIEPETWNYISEGKVKVGMTKDEVRLALGTPADLNSGHDYSQTLDIWSYENGRVLWFEDGRLVKIRQ
ncbi:MAG: hypothetical protein J1E16_08960 [Muribaculaceae bacterium]|nr:hypothetical protein [Muribaculaceae bacterium]